MALPIRALFVTYETKRLRNKSLGTSGQYWSAINRFEEFLKRDATTDDLFDERVQSFQQWLVDGREIAIDTAVSYCKKLLALWRFGARHRLVENWPEVELLRCPEREPIAWARPEMETKWRALCQADGQFGAVPCRAFWPALESVFWDSAERLGAVLMLRTEDVSLPAAWAICRAESRKGRLRDRGFPLHPQTVELLQRLDAAAGKRRLVFEVPFGEQTLRDKYKQILRAAGLPFDRRHLFHCNRKTAASWFEFLGGDAMKLLDHSSREVTRRYLAPQVTRPQHAADLLWRPGELPVE